MRKLLASVVVLVFLFHTSAYAVSPSVKKAIVVGKAGLFGFAGGLVLGVASQAIKKESKNIFVGGSIGLYIGILAGVYLILTTHASSEDVEGHDTYDDYEGKLVRDQKSYFTQIDQNRALDQHEAKLGLRLFKASF